eukprot:c11092_g1_i1.p1 GENE.c11092_g1_i1~~c11092_g1_i1.p1  ORF type:complete len:536 (-),score=88.09 c11092_g1_i1:41-1648(-)
MFLPSRGVCLLLALVGVNGFARHHHVANSHHHSRDLEEQSFVPKPEFLFASTDKVCERTGRVSPDWNDYLDPLSDKCGCACTGPNCFQCPSGSKNRAGPKAPLSCKKCPVGYSSAGTCVTAGSTQEIKVELKIPTELFDDCVYVPGSPAMVTCTKECSHPRKYEAIDHGKPCGHMEYDSTVKSLDIIKRTVFTEVTSKRTLDIKCPGSQRLVQEMQGSTAKYFCVESFATAGSTIPEVRVDPVCVDGVPVGSEFCFVADTCPKKPNSVDANLGCAPLTGKFLKTALARMDSEMQSPYESVSPSKDEAFFTCLTHCVFFAAKREECDSLGAFITSNGGVSEAIAALGSPQAEAADEDADLEEVLDPNMTLDIFLSLISSCYSDPLLLHPSNLGKIDPSTGTFVVHSHAQEKILSKIPTASKAWPDYAEFNIPKAFSRAVNSVQAKVLTMDIDLMFQASCVSSFKDYVARSSITHSEKVASKNCREWAKGAIQKVRQFEENCPSKASGKNYGEKCLLGCRAHHRARSRNLGLSDMVC